MAFEEMDFLPPRPAPAPPTGVARARSSLAVAVADARRAAARNRTWAGRLARAIRLPHGLVVRPDQGDEATHYLDEEGYASDVIEMQPMSYFDFDSDEADGPTRFEQLKDRALGIWASVKNKIWGKKKTGRGLPITAIRPPGGTSNMMTMDAVQVASFV